MKDFKTSHTPTVLYDNYIPANPFIASIGIDNNEGMTLAVSHLKELGHRKIGYLSSALGSHIMQVRHKAFFHAMKQNDLHTEPTYAGSSYYITQCVEKHLPRLLQMGMTAIICSHDLIANAVMVQCRTSWAIISLRISASSVSMICPSAPTLRLRSLRSARARQSSANAVTMRWTVF